MIKKWFFLAGLFLALTLNVSSQDSSGILLQIGDENVPAEEFWAIYQKNSKINPQSEKTSLDEYLNLFINFKLKVKEAKDAKMDTNAAFIKELNGYRKQLVKPYLVVAEADDEMAREVYNRMQNNVRASHLLLRLPENPLPGDTLAVYQTAMQIRKSIINNEISFADAAVQFSEDASARDMAMGNDRPVRKGNKGDLGYFGVFDMVFPFEEAVFNLQKGEITNPVRTQFGYHLIYLTDKIPAIGEAKAAHLFIKNATPSSVDSAKLRIDQLYNEIQNGKSFEDLVVQYSDDKGTSEKGGELPWFTANRMVPEFIKAISVMKVGEISAPIKTSFGWHILKFIDQRPLGDFEKLREEIVEKLKRDVRSHKGEQAKIAQIKAEENFKEFPENLQEAILSVDTNFYNLDFKIESLSYLSKPIFSVRNRSYSQYDFLDYLYQLKGTERPADYTVLFRQIYQEYVNRQCLNFEEEHLEEKYQDFRLIINEYREGILLFDLMDKKVWSRATEDSLGLAKFFAANRNNYKWKQRAQISVFNITNKNQSEQVRKLLKQGKTDEEILLEFQSDSLHPVSLEKHTIEKGNNGVYDNLKWKKSAYYSLSDEDAQPKSVVAFRGFLKPSLKAFNETRGILIADYQDQLEKEWIAELRKRYEVKVNKAVLNTLKERDN